MTFSALPQEYMELGVSKSIKTSPAIVFLRAKCDGAAMLACYSIHTG